MVVEQLVEFLHRLNDEEHVAILLVEQNALLAFDLCERAYVLETGRVVLEERRQIRDRPRCTALTSEADPDDRVPAARRRRARPGPRSRSSG